MRLWRSILKSIAVVLPILGILAGVYLLINSLTPAMSWFDFRPKDATERKLELNKPDSSDNHLYIPKLNLDVAILTGDASVLEKGAWHRKPENGDPASGGNFVLSAHRFNLGLTPQLTRAKSPFYHIDRLQNGDEIYVDYNGKRYAYEVTKRYKVDRTAIEIETRSDSPKMTLYSCDLRGEKAGREVVEAVLKDLL